MLIAGGWCWYWLLVQLLLGQHQREHPALASGNQHSAF
jgi:hypothetical protein